MMKAASELSCLAKGALSNWVLPSRCCRVTVGLVNALTVLWPRIPPIIATFGGRAVPLGTLLGSLFLVLLVTAMQVAGLKIGGQLVAEGLFIILVLFLAMERIRQ